MEIEIVLLAVVTMLNSLAIINLSLKRRKSDVDTRTPFQRYQDRVRARQREARDR